MAMPLTVDQRSFLKHHGILLSKVFDATGMPTWLYKDIMSDGGFLVAYGVTPCKEAGHMLRARAGHCVQCNPAAIAFQQRPNAPSIVYIAESEELGLCKVGISGDPDARIARLNEIGYANATDWTVRRRVSCDRAGHVESQVHRMLHGFKEKASYNRDGRLVDCYEVFACSVDSAIEAIINVTQHE
jgi:hypothetical protein